MIPMTTQNLGQRPGRARLGACGHLAAAGSHRSHADWSRRWQETVLASATATGLAAMPYVGTATVGKRFGSINRPARHLGTRST